MTLCSIMRMMRSSYRLRTYLYCVKLALENNTGMQPATRESKRDLRVRESPISGVRSFEGERRGGKISGGEGVYIHISPIMKGPDQVSQTKDEVHIARIVFHSFTHTCRCWTVLCPSEEQHRVRCVHHSIAAVCSSAPLT